MKIYDAVLDPITNASIKIKLYRNVKNVPELRKKIVSGELKCCVMKPTLIVDPFQVVIAANKALVAEKQGKLRTRSIFSEILFNLSISKNVSKSLPLFGIDDKYSDILVAVIYKDDDTFDDIFNVIQGDECDINELKTITDIKVVKKVYNINSDEETHLLNTIVNKIVIKDFSY